MTQKALARLVGQVVARGRGAQAQARPPPRRGRPRGLPPPAPAPVRNAPGRRRRSRGADRRGRDGARGSRRSSHAAETPPPAVAGQRPAPRRARDRWSRRPSAPPRLRRWSERQAGRLGDVETPRMLPQRLDEVQGFSRQRSGLFGQQGRELGPAQRRQREPNSRLRSPAPAPRGAAGGTRRSSRLRSPRSPDVAAARRRCGPAFGRAASCLLRIRIDRSPRGLAGSDGCQSLRTALAGQRECSF